MDSPKLQKTSIASKLESTEHKASYDAACKRLLSEKVVLAHVMKSYLTEFQDCSVNEIANRYIEGTPLVDAIPITTDKTNPAILGMDSSDKTTSEGEATYDILFRALVPNTQEEIGVIINVEAQKDSYPGYPIVTRGIYYCARLLSSQYNREFTNSHYEKLKKVYSIWICLNPPVKDRNSVTSFDFQPHTLGGNSVAPVSSYDLMSVITVYLGGPGTKNYSGTLRMLDILLSDVKSAAEKAKTLQNDYGIQMTQTMEKEATNMCNLSEAIEQRTTEKNYLSSIQSILKKTQLSVDQAMDLIDIPENDRPKYLELLNQQQQ